MKGNSFTAHCNAQIDQTIDRHMMMVADHVTQAVSDVHSIVLAGGFGRGEGSVRQLTDGRYVPMNDYDIYVITDAHPSHLLCERLRAELTDRIGVRTDLKFINREGLGTLIPELFTFELKMASRVVWGKDLRPKIPLKKSDIPLSAGLNTLFIEMVGLIENFEPRFFSGTIPKSRVPMASYLCSKVFIEICTALSLLGGFYDPSIMKRASFLCGHYEDLFPELRELLPDLATKVTYHTNLKLRSLKFESNGLVERWLDARKALEFATWYYISRVLNEPLNKDQGFLDFLDTHRRRIAAFYFEPYTKYALKQKGIRLKSKLLTTLTPIVLIYENLRYMRNSYNSMGKIHLMPFLRFHSPLINIYISAAFLLFSLGQNDICREYVEKARGLLSGVYSCSVVDKDEAKNWSRLRNACLSSFKVYASTPTTLAL